MKTALLTGLACAISFATSGWAADCNTSKWGADDEIGSANLISPENTLKAAQLIKQGKSMPLGIVIDSNTPAFPPRSLSLQVVQPSQQGGQKLNAFGYPGNYNDDLLQTWVGIGSQIDGLGHLGEKGFYYNCSDEKEISAITGLTKLGVHNVPPLVGRAVILDMAKHFGKPALAAGEHFGEADIKAAAEAQGVTMGEGDIILFHTGWTDAMLKDDPKAWVSGEPGINNEGSRYIASLNPMAVGADTWGVEPVPAAEGDGVFYGHVIFLKENGIYLLETMNTGPLVAEGVNEFMFVLGQARIRGTVQMIINPVALY
ncbi:cyclase family protein [Phaeobacter gallaeciensis]|uniref:Cyclase family protein n=2 Tax=Roseobacteraceae TaxID=2854170 RepID=A0A366WNS2_9RHOB|nr:MULTISPECIES: cyclase family protein [Roseobacteraceae]MBT3140123.1 cyclase family protein [Falsiruegeria litorea]MBT8169117.1 cyclase family protein [Falsiruegeria litorea]RBW50511.1 cyclase family protein [Phaeobacter gallaeciensis]